MYVVLVGVEIWVERDEIEIVDNADTTMNNFLEYRRNHISPKHSNDNAHLITYVTTFAFRSFRIAAPHYPLASAVLPLQTLSVASLKLSASSRPTAPPKAQIPLCRLSPKLPNEESRGHKR